MHLGNNYKDSGSWARAEPWKPPKDDISRGGAWPTVLEIIAKICGLEVASTVAFQQLKINISNYLGNETFFISDCPYDILNA